MKPIACYLYEEGRDFSLPEEYVAAETQEYILARGVTRAPDGALRPLPEIFTPASPDAAEIFLFPYDLGSLRNVLLVHRATGFLSTLPYMAGRENRHVFWDGGDNPDCIALPALLFKTSLVRRNALEEHKICSLESLRTHPSAPRCVIMGYRLPAHVAADAPHFDWDAIRYDCSFVGAYTHILRNMAVNSLLRVPELRFYNGGFDSVLLGENFFQHRPVDAEEKQRRERLFRKVTKASLTVLCPPGIGPQSFRLYETMYYGRIPVLFTRNVCYPHEDAIEYEEFCLFIEERDVLRTGEILRDWLNARSQEELRRKCALACRIWNRWFSPANEPRLIAQAIHTHLDAVG